jgi:hypothetical protein
MDHYIDGIHHALLPLDANGQAADPETVLDEAGQGILRAIVGVLLWVATSCRPDISAKVSMLAGWLGKGRVAELIKANKVVDHLKKHRFPLRFPKMGLNLKMKVYTDSGFANLPDGWSQGGFIISLEDAETGVFCPISWASRKLRRVTRSTIASETEAMVEGIDDAVLLVAVWDWIFGGVLAKLSNNVYTDCKSLYDHLRAKGGPTQEKRLKLSLSSIFQDISEGTVGEVNWIMSEDMLADGLTKEMYPQQIMEALRESRTKIREGLKGRIKSEKIKMD